MRHFELPVFAAVAAPPFDEFAVLRKLHHARVAASGVVAVGNKDIAIGRECDRVRLVERVRAVARYSGLAERHEHLAIFAELEYLLALAVLALAVAHPEIAVAVEGKAMRKDEHARAEGLQQFAVRVEFHDGIERRPRTAIHSAPVGDPDVAVAGGEDRAARAHRPPCGKREPVLHCAVRVGLRKRHPGHQHYSQRNLPASSLGHQGRLYCTESGIPFHSVLT